MDERVEEIKPISRIRPVRKVALAKPRRGRRELMYQYNRYKKPKRIKKRLPNASKTIETSPISNSNDYAVDLKKRIAFDRAMIIGD